MAFNYTFVFKLKIMIHFKIDEFFDTNSIGKAAELFEKMSEERFFVKHIGLSYRVINSRDEKGLIRCSRKKEGGDRKFSFADFVWIKIVEELRSFGVPVPTIKTITDDIYGRIPMKELFESVANNIKMLDRFEGTEKDEIVAFLKSEEYKDADFSELNFSFLHLLMTEAIAGREAISLIVFKDGEWFPFIPSKENIYTDEILNKKKFSSHISICLLDIVFQFFTSDAAVKFMKDFKLLTEQEQNVLDEADKGSYKKITVLFKTKKYEPLEIKKSKVAKTQLVNIIRDKQYREFIVTDNKGNEFKVKG
jgi:DNA-binding transcriptional MerR regulator